MKNLIYLFLFFTGLSYGQTEFTAIKLKNSPVTIDDNTKVDLLVRENSGPNNGMVRKITWDYISNLFESNVIPLTGTTEGNPITGDLQFSGARKIFNGDANKNSTLYLNENSAVFEADDFTNGISYSSQGILPNAIFQQVYTPTGTASVNVTNSGISFSAESDGNGGSVTINTDGVAIGVTNSTSKGLTGNNDYSGNNDGTDRNVYPQTGWVQDAINTSVGGVSLQGIFNTNSGTATTTNPFEVYSSNYINFTGASGANVLLASTGGGKVGIYTSGTGYTFFTTANTAQRTVAWPDKSGTAALTSDIPVIDATPINGNLNGISSDWAYDYTVSNTANLAAKQAMLVSLGNIRTVEGQTLLGSTNIDLGKSDVGLSNVDNTSDVGKPVSTAQQTAIDAKVQNTSMSSSTTTTAPSTPLVKTYIDSYFTEYPETTYVETITWNGTAPTGTITTTWRATRIGKKVTVRVASNATTPGVTNTSVLIPLPSTLPSPSGVTGFTATNDFPLSAVGYIMNATNVAPGASRAVLRKTAGGYSIYITAGSMSATGFITTLDYWID